MRVIAGKARGAKLDCPTGMVTRPTPAIAREALFNILREYVEGSTILDIFAGAGTVGIEALSRGAKWCVFVEKAFATRQVLEHNLTHTRLAEFCDVLQRDAFHCVEAVKKLGRVFDLVYLGPPFPMWHDPQQCAALVALFDEIAAAEFLKSDAMLVAQHEPDTDLPDATDALTRTDQRTYGRNVFSFYEQTASLKKS